MSKGGGAGKVYFVLYLAVILELLIIIVERDEAEEGLMQKQKESMKIVESILSQLQSGAGSEGINTRPQDEITLTEGMNNPELIKNFKDFRRYSVEVGVTDIGASMYERKEGEGDEEWHERLHTFVKLANVSDLDYQVFYSPDDKTENAPEFPSDEDFKKKIDVNKLSVGQTLPGGEVAAKWEFLALKRLELDNDATYKNLINEVHNTKEGFVMHPIYKKGVSVGGPFAPNGVTDDSVFAYSADKTTELSRQIAGGLAKRAFFVQFKPPSRPGWYKLRFASRTNKILGVRAEENAAELKEETTVNIGTVQLKVKDLLKVKKELNSKLAKYGLPEMESLGKGMDIYQFDEELKKALELAGKEEKANEIQSQINLYGYIAKLLAPGQSDNLKQNRNSIEFNIHVVKPDIPKADPTVVMDDAFSCFDLAAPAVGFTIGPFQGNNSISGVVKDINGADVARVNCKPVDEVNASVPKPAQGGNRDYIGIVDKELSPGKYKLYIYHSLGSKKGEDIADIEVFPSKLTEKSLSDVNSKLKLYTYYGNNLKIAPEPTSGSKIKGNQFRIYLGTDKDTQKPPFEGLLAELPLNADARSVNARITWIQPITGREIELMPLTSAEIKQEPPRINSGSMQTSFSGGERKVKVKVSGLTISPGMVGDPSNPLAKPDVKIKAGKTTVNVSGYSLAGEPIWSPSDNSVTVELTGALGRQDRVSGNIEISLVAYSINPINGKTSEEAVKKIPVKINYEPEVEKKAQPRRR